MGVRQMGHFSACMRRTWAHSEHRHMWRQGRTVVSLGADLTERQGEGEEEGEGGGGEGQDFSPLQ